MNQIPYESEVKSLDVKYFLSRGIIFRDINHIRAKIFRDMMKIKGKILRAQIPSSDEIIRDIIH